MDYRLANEVNRNTIKMQNEMLMEKLAIIKDLEMEIGLWNRKVSVYYGVIRGLLMERGN